MQGLWFTLPKIIKNVNRAALNSYQNSKQPNIALQNVVLNIDGKTKKNIVGKQEVYNLKVDKIPLYYANGVLVHNCDSFSQFLTWFKNNSIDWDKMFSVF
jgi:hypothetical protein